MKFVTIILVLFSFAYAVITCKGVDYLHEVQCYLDTLSKSVEIITINDNGKYTYPLIIYKEGKHLKVHDAKEHNTRLIRCLLHPDIKVIPILTADSFMSRCYSFQGDSIISYNTNHFFLLNSSDAGGNICTGTVFELNIDDNGHLSVVEDVDGLVYIDRSYNTSHNYVNSLVFEDKDGRRLKYCPQGKIDISSKTISSFLIGNNIATEEVLRVYGNQVLLYRDRHTRHICCYSSLLDKVIVYPDYCEVFPIGDNALFYSKQNEIKGYSLCYIDLMSFNEKVITIGDTVYTGVIDNCITVKGYDGIERHFDYGGEEFYDVIIDVNRLYSFIYEAVEMHLLMKGIEQYYNNKSSISELKSLYDHVVERDRSGKMKMKYRDYHSFFSYLSGTE